MSKNNNVGSLSLSTTVATRFLSLWAVLLAALLPASAIAADVVLQPNQGPVGTGVTATGMGWPPGTGVLIYIESQQIGGPVIPDASGAFTTTFCIPDKPPRQPGAYPVFFTNGRENFNPPFTITAGSAGSCQGTANCPHDAYFIGAHGTFEGPDGSGTAKSQAIVETAVGFLKELKAKLGQAVVDVHYLEYPSPGVSVLPTITIDDFISAKDKGVDALDRHVRNTVLNECINPKIVLVGYSLGAWVINEWLGREENKNLWPNIRAVELYGDPLWHRSGNDYLGQTYIYNGIAHLPGFLDPYQNSPPGPGVEIADRWQSRCLKGDAVCGEGYNGITQSIQYPLALDCINNSNCEHRRYTKDQGGHDLTTRGAEFMALKAFPSGNPKIERVETFREGELVFFRLFFSDPNDEVKGFGFVGIKGSGWAKAEFPLSNPGPYGRVSLEQRRIELPFNHACGTPFAYESDIEVWISDHTGQPISSNEVHLACSSAPCEVVTPYSSFTWSNTANLNECR